MSFIALLLTFAALPAEVPCSKLTRAKLLCPTCRQLFETVLCVNANTAGGVDRDLFARALGPQPEYYRISTCPRCGYSGYTNDFDESVVIPPDVRDKILKTPALPLPEGFTPTSDPRDLDAADRYALAVTCYQWRQQSDEALAWLHLRASWIARDEGAVLPRDPRLARVMKHIERWRPTRRARENQADAEMQTATRMAEAIAIGRFNRYQRPYVELALAMILRRHGENRQVGLRLDELTGYEGFSQVLCDGIERMRTSIARERQHQRLAADYFERALLSEQVAPRNQAPARYLLGELYRRLGRDDAAIIWYDKALASPDLPPNLKTWARSQRAWCRPDPGQDSPRMR